MTTVLKRLWNDERGFIVSAEIVLIMTIGVLGIVVGISSVASSINNELNDVSSAFGAVDQSYWYSGLVKVGHAGVTGSAYADTQDFCDCTSIVRTVPGAKIQTGSPIPLRPPVTRPVVPRRRPPAPCATGACPSVSHPCPPAYRPVPCPLPSVPQHHHGHPSKPHHDKAGRHLKPHPDPKFKPRKR